MEILHGFIQTHSILISAAILLLSYLLIIVDKLPRIAVVLLGASATVILGILSQEKGYHGNFDSNYFINYIDFNVIFLLVSMMIIVNITAKSGVFNWIAKELLKFTKGSPKLVLLTLGLATAVASAFLDNVTTVILVMPITFIIAKELDINPIPLLITEIITSNIGGTATLIGDPPNIIIGSAAGLSFGDFLLELTGVIIIILLTSVGVLAFIFRKDLETTPEKMQNIKKIDNSKTITDKKLMIRSTTVLALVILGFLLHGVIHLQASVVAMTGAAFLLLFEKPEKEILHKVEWNTIFFFIGLFIIIGGLEASGGIALIAKKMLELTQGSQSATAMTILWASGILSGLIDNIPYTVTMTPMLLHIQNTMGTAYAHPLWWCLSLGACLGGNLTIIGAAANVIVSETAASAGHHISFTKFMKYGLLITFISLILSSIYIYLRFLT